MNSKRNGRGEFIGPKMDVNMPINLGEIIHICAEHIKIDCNNAGDSITARICFNDGAEPDNFGMALLRAPLDGKWDVFFERYSLCFNYETSENLSATVEIKNVKNGLLGKITGEGKRELKINSHGATAEFNLALKEINSNRSAWKDVAELCFTVFNKDVKGGKGSFTISDCRLVRNDAKEGGEGIQKN